LWDREEGGGGGGGMGGILHNLYDGRIGVVSGNDETGSLERRIARWRTAESEIGKI
jgi:hypothetical protein